MKGGNKMYTVNEAAELFGVHRNTIINWINAGDLVAIKLKKSYKITEEDINRFIEERKTD